MTRPSRGWTGYEDDAVKLLIRLGVAVVGLGVGVLAFVLHDVGEEPW